jgi:hypothetical protein
MSHCNGEIIDQGALWYLVRVPEYPAWESWVVHGCKPHPDSDAGGGIHHELGYFTRIDQPDPVCMGCGLVTPEKWKTVWTLHNWDAIAAFYQRNPE